MPMLTTKRFSARLYDYYEFIRNKIVAILHFRYEAVEKVLFFAGMHLRIMSTTGLVACGKVLFTHVNEQFLSLLLCMSDELLTRQNKYKSVSLTTKITRRQGINL